MPKTINEEAGLGPNWVPVDVPPIVPGQAVGAPSAASLIPTNPQYFQGSIPPSFQHDVHFVDTATLTPNAPKFSLMPLGLSQNAVATTQITSVVKTASTPVVPTAAFYQTIELNGSAQTQRPILNFLQTALFSSSDNASNNSTDISLNIDVASGLPTLDTNAHLKPAEQQYGVNEQVGLTYAIADTDRWKMLTFTNSSSVAVSIPQAGASSLFISGWSCLVINEGTNIVTITPTTSTIDGAASLILNPTQGIILISDGTNYFTLRGTGGGFATSVAIKTGNYPVANSDGGKLLVANSSSALSFTLPASAPPSGFSIAVQNINSGTLTINPNGLNLDGSASSLSVYQNEGLFIASNGSNYYTVRGMLPPITGDVSFSGLASTVVAIQNISVINTPPTTGQALVYNGSQYVPTTVQTSSGGPIVEVNAVTVAYDGLIFVIGVCTAAPVWGVAVNGVTIIQ